MRKTVSLALALVMLFTTVALTSCDALLDSLGTGGNTGGNTGENSGENSGGSDDTGTPPKEVRYTVTEEEWNNMWSYRNFTYETGYEDDGLHVQKYLVTDTAVKVVSSQSLYAPMLVLKDGKCYNVGKMGDEYVGIEADSDFSAYNLGGITSFGEIIVYDKFKYDEATKSYVGVIEDTNVTLSFKDGVLFEFYAADDGAHIKICDVGTTEVEVPDFKVYDDSDDDEDDNTDINPPIFNGGADESERYTITGEEWLAAVSCTNFTSSNSYYFVSDDVDAEILATERIAMMITSDSQRVVRHTLNADDTWSESENYFTTVDDKIYVIIKTDTGDYVASETEGMPELTLAVTFSTEEVDLTEIYDSLVYNEENNSYSYTYMSDDVVVFYEIAFYDGELVAFGATQRKDNLLITVVCSNFGTTVVNLPEYTFA